MDDLFFSVKVHDAAKKLNLIVEFVKSDVDVLEKAKDHPSLIIFDLNFSLVQPLKLIAELKAKPEFKGISLVGYLSHAQGDLKMKAQQAGADMVLARSTFLLNLSQILKRHVHEYQ